MERGTKDGFGSTLTPLPDGGKDLVEGQLLLPLHPVFCIVAQAGAMQAQETHQSVDAQFAAKDVQCMPFNCSSVMASRRLIKTCLRQEASHSDRNVFIK